jgi:hypothetical protein
MAHFIGSETPSDALIQPVWTYRVLPSLALIALLLAQTLAARTPLWHDFFLGLATGLLIVLCVLGFTAKPTNA